MLYQKDSFWSTLGWT